MFNWYAWSKICYGYLADYRHGYGNLDNCRWFSRGWTLQELIAPAEIRFYDSRWVPFGTRDDNSDKIACITGIDRDILWRVFDDGDLDLELVLNEISIAVRMSWASKRETTRSEDIAYCLLGIFGVNLPLLYGEGVRAFLRLQEEIIKHSNDLSILGWRRRAPDKYCGVLAQHLRFFESSNKLRQVKNLGFYFDSDITSISKGLKLELALGWHAGD